MDGAVPDLRDVTVDIEVVSPEPEQKLQRLFAIWQERCPIYLGLIKLMAVAASLTVENGS